MIAGPYLFVCFTIGAGIAAIALALLHAHGNREASGQTRLDGGIIQENNNDE